MADESELSTVLHRKALKWNGTNQAQIAAKLAGYAFVSVGGSGELNFTISGNPWTVPANGYIHYDGTGAMLDVSVSQVSYDQVFSTVVLADDAAAMGETLGELGSAVTALEELTAGGIGKSIGFVTQVVSVGDSTVDVPLIHTMPSEDFIAEADTFGGVGLGALSVTGTEILDESTVRVSLSNSGLAVTATVVVWATVESEA